MPNFYAPRRHPKDREIGPRDDLRDDGMLRLKVNGYDFDYRLVPDARDVRLWLPYRDGERVFTDGKPLRCGLEPLWRLTLSQIAPTLGRAHWT